MSHADLMIRRARADHADKAWLREANASGWRAMQMLTGAAALAVAALLGLLMGLAGADWWTDAGLVVDLIASWRTAP